MASSLPLVPFPLNSLSRVAAVNDTLLANNASGVTVFGIDRRVPPAPPSQAFDLALIQTALTDTSIILNGQNEQAVVKGSLFAYKLSVVNNGPRTAKNISLSATIPDSVSLSAFSLLPSGRTAIPCSGNSIRYSPDKRSRSTIRLGWHLPCHWCHFH